MKALMKPLRAWLSLGVGIAVTFFSIGYGVTDEVPVGTLTGAVTMQENGKPLPKAFVTVTRLAQDDLYEDEDIASEHHFMTDKAGHFQLHNMLAGRYRIEVSSKAHKDKRDIEVLEGKTTSLDLAAAPIDPYLELYASQRVYLPAEMPKVQLHGFSHSDDLSLSIYKLDFDKVVKEGGLYTALAPLARKANDKVKDPATMGKLLQSVGVPLTDRDAEGTFRLHLPVPQLEEGLYWINCASGKALSAGTWLSISKIALITKNGRNDLVAYVTKLDTGEPVPGAAISFSSVGSSVASGTTKSDGIARLKVPAKEPNASEVVVASSGGSRALVDFERADPQDQDEEDTGGKYSETKIYCYTDRPLYRPGDDIQYKGIVRHLNDSTYVLPKQKQVTVEFTDGSGTVLATQQRPVTEMGTYNGQFQLAADALPDDYSIVTHYGSTTENESVGVAAYRKPSYSITVEPEKKVYIRGDTAKVDIAAKYYYGSPVVGAEVTATVTRQQNYGGGDESADEGNEFDEGSAKMYPGQSLQSDSGEGVQLLKGTTDENGKVVLSFPTAGVNESEEAQADYDYSIYVSIKDSSDKVFTGSGDMTVRRSEDSIQLETDPMVVMAGDPFLAKATLKGPDRRPLSGKAVHFVGGFARFNKDGEEVLADQRNFDSTAGPDGVAVAQIQPEGQGYYEVRATFKDERGHDVTERTDVFLYSERPGTEMTGYIPDSDLSVILDKKRYRVGDTAKAVITCKDPGGTALVAIEGTLIHMAEAVKLNSRTTLYKFKIVNDYSPDVFLSTAYIRNKHYASVNKQVLINLGAKRLNVELASDKKTYHPGETAVYTVITKSASGQPVPAEVSLGVVDESIYSIFDDQSNIVDAFYPMRDDNIATNYSFPELYLGGGDKAPTNITVRRNFKDTAFWAPVVDTDKSGTAKVAVKLPDNLTGWRTTVRAVTGDTQVGQTTENVVAQKDLMIQLSAPAYVVMGDQQRLVAMVTNNTPADADVHVNLQATNAKVDGDLSAVVHVPKGSMQTVEYKLSTVNTGTADFVGKAWIASGSSAAAISDGMELKVPVHPHARLVTDGYGGVTTSTKEVDFDLKQGADPNSGDLVIGIAPTIATSLVDSINELVNFPYGCVEQTTSRFLPTVVLAKTYSQIGLPKPKLSKQINDIVVESYERLESMHHGDGGWGWWEFGDSDPHMTAYVLEAVYRSKLAGYDAPSRLDVSQALDWSVKFLANGKLSNEIERPTAEGINRLATEKMYLAYALALNGKPKEALAYLDAQEITKLDSAQAAFAALAYNQLGASEASKRDRALNRMIFLGKETRSTLTWKEEDWWGYETTGRCFEALETIRPQDPRIEKIVTALMQSRTGPLWYSTRDTAAILLAMADYLQHSKELLSSANLGVSLNGKDVSEVQFAQGQFPDRPATVKLHISDLRPGKNRLIFRATSGVCYYTATLKQYDAAQDLPAMPEGNQLMVTRTYYKLEARRMEDGTLKLMPSRSPVSDYKSGDILRCVLKIHTDAPRDYVYVEDPTPSGLHVTDRETPDQGETWAFWWSRTVILDDKVCLFASYVNGGDSEMSYVLQAENPGTCDALPTTIYNMYDASDTASGESLALSVQQ